MSKSEDRPEQQPDETVSGQGEPSEASRKTLFDDPTTDAVEMHSGSADDETAAPFSSRKTIADIRPVLQELAASSSGPDKTVRDATAQTVVDHPGVEEEDVEATRDGSQMTSDIQDAAFSSAETLPAEEAVVPPRDRTAVYPTGDTVAWCAGIVQEQQPARYRPTIRPLTALLRVFDDWGDSAEVVRIRSAQFRIGRTEGELVLPHDSQMSSRHLEIKREQQDRGWVWHLSDLGSTNGTFIRVTSVRLHHGQELYVGSHRYRFEVKADTSAPPSTPSDTVRSAHGKSARLVCVTADQSNRYIPLNQCEQWLGSDPDHCDNVLHDPCASRQEARIARDENDLWSLSATASSVNGVWVRLASLVVPATGVQFQCGEQRFELQVGPPHP